CTWPRGYPLVHLAVAGGPMSLICLCSLQSAKSPAKPETAVACANQVRFWISPRLPSDLGKSPNIQRS
ncbi:hypothetical protein T265_01573, partial [Opisthorchis viverrini]